MDRMTRDAVTTRAQAVLVAGAVGDALGWPHERRDRVQGTVPTTDGEGAGVFFSWTRQAGSRFQPLHEEIGAGEYSDDTQLVIATARARLATDGRWVERLTDVELPFFLQYERGAGASVKRSCRAWRRRKSPWQAAQGDSAKYFAAGANGAAMRIAPHVLIHHTDNNFAALAADVTQDAVLTHGHPRALVGALAYAYALWASLRQTQPIRYGWLIEELISGVKAWSGLCEPVLDDRWLQLADQQHANNYRNAWAQAVDEVAVMLEQASEALKLGAVGNPKSYADAIGATTTKSNGAGTVSAVLAVFLAAWSAANPQQGLRTAATLKGADTDTLASMTGGLLGAALGGDWLGTAGQGVQDALLLRRLATDLIRPNQSAKRQLALPLESSGPAIVRTVDDLPNLEPGQGITLPNGCEARVEDATELRSGARPVQRLRMRTDDGQTLYFIHTKPQLSETDSALPHGAAKSPPTRLEVASNLLAAEVAGVEIKATNLNQTRFILEQIIGVSPIKSGSGWVRYPGLFVVEGRAGIRIDSPVVRIRIRSHSSDEIRSRAESAGLMPHKPPRDEGQAFGIEIAPGVLALVARH